jgi:hypothetical protein
MSTTDLIVEEAGETSVVLYGCPLLGLPSQPAAVTAAPAAFEVDLVVVATTLPQKFCHRRNVAVSG